jgi:hypothetical protein
VPHGSVLDTILFSLNIKDLPINTHGAGTVLFSNDIYTLIKVANGDRMKQNITEVMGQLSSWFHVNG